MTLAMCLLSLCVWVEECDRFKVRWLHFIRNSGLILTYMLIVASCGELNWYQLSRRAARHNKRKIWEQYLFFKHRVGSASLPLVKVNKRRRGCRRSSCHVKHALKTYIPSSSARELSSYHPLVTLLSSIVPLWGEREYLPQKAVVTTIVYLLWFWIDWILI